MRKDNFVRMLKLEEGERGGWKETIDPPREKRCDWDQEQKRSNQNRENMSSGLYTGGYV
jgi:hypothetical protein